MHGLWFEGGSLQLKDDLPLPVVRDEWTLIKVSLAGICSTDLAILQGYASFKGVLGHEFVGTVVQSNSAAIKVGDRVVGEINAKCGHCDVCIGPSPPCMARNHCPRRKCLGIRDLNGAFAEYITLPASNLFVVGDSVSDDMAVFAEPVAAACRIVEQIGNDLEKDPQVAVMGDGKLGLLISAVLLSAFPSIRLTLVGRHEEKMAKLRFANREFKSVILGNNDLGSFENMFDICVEATGSHYGLHSCTRLCRPLGTVVVKSTCSNEIEHSIEMSESRNDAQNLVVIKELRLIGSRCGPFDIALKMISDPTSPVSLVLPHIAQDTFSLDQFETALEIAQRKGALKILFHL